MSSNQSIQVWKVAELDFTHVTRNLTVAAQGKQTCINVDNKGWFCPLLGRFLSRQDLAVITNRRMINIG